MKRKPPLPNRLPILLALASLLVVGSAEEKSAAAVQGAPSNAQANVPPVIFFPGIPSLLLPNPLAKVETRAGFLGVQLETDSDAAADDEIGKKDAAKKIAGAGITSVIEGGPAAKAGLKEGDRVLTINGKEAKNSGHLREMIRALNPEQDVKLLVRRDGKEVEVKAKLGEAPQSVAAVPLLQLNGLNFGIPGGQNEPEAVPGVVTFPAGAGRGITTTINGFTIVDGRAVANVSRTFGTTKVTSDMDTVTLRDGNRFTGKILGIDPAKGLRLHRDGQVDLELVEEEIAALTFAERQPGDGAAKVANGTAMPKVVLQLRDGSILNGEALTMENGRLSLALPGGQRIEIPREHAYSATLSDGESPQIYEGPSSLGGWSSGRYNQAQWEYKDGMLRSISNGPIGRDFGRFPDPMDLSFDVNFPRQMQHLGVTLFSTGVSESGVGALSLNFSPDRIYGSHYDGKRSNQYNAILKQNAVPDFSARPETMHYRILADRVKGSVLIYLNGVKRADWKLSKVKPEDLGKCGATFSITPHATMSEVTFQVGRVRVFPWDGKEPADGAIPAEAKGDHVLTSDGATTCATLDRITDGEVLFTERGAKVRREKTVLVRFVELTPPKEIPEAVAMVRLGNGSEISTSKVSGNGATLAFSLRSGPQIALPFSSLRSLDFLPRKGQPDTPAKDLDILTLTDGTQFNGKALLAANGAEIGWKIAAAKVPLGFPAEKIAGILLRSADGARKATPLKGDSVLRLGNGDWLPGEVISLDGTRLVMKTDLTPALPVPLSALRAIYLNPAAAATIADGASGTELWSEGWNPNRSSYARRVTVPAPKSERAWSYFDGGYTARGILRSGENTVATHWSASVGAYALNFDTITAARSPYFNIQLYNAKDERTFTISCSGTRMYVYYNLSSARVNRIGLNGNKQFTLETPKDSSNGTTHISVVLDRPANTLRIFVAGKEIGKIAFKEEDAREALDARGMTITTSYYSSSSARQSRIDRLWFAPGNGLSNADRAAVAKAPEKEKTGAEQADSKKDATPDAGAPETPVNAPVLYLANGDEFPGAIEKITPDLVVVNSEAGPLEFPGKRVAWIHFPGCAEPIADHFPRLRFHDRGLLSVNDLHVTADRVQCRMLDGQALDFPLSTVKEIVWRPIESK